MCLRECMYYLHMECFIYINVCYKDTLIKEGHFLKYYSTRVENII